MAATTLLPLGCGDQPEPGNGSVSTESPGEVGQELGSGDACPTAAPDLTVTGGGSVTSGRTYDHSGCWAGYLVDIRDYDPGNTGTLAYYADTVPTTEQGCKDLQMRVYAWKRNAKGTMTYLGGRFPRGAWVTNRSGAQFCEVPWVHVERSIPGFKADGGDYRLGMRAQDLDGAGNMRRRRIFFETVKKRDMVAERAALRQEIANAAAGTVISKIRNAWATRSTGAHQIQCRNLQLVRSMHEFSKASFVKAGAAGATIDAARSAIDAMYGALCAAGGTEAQLQRMTKQFLDSSEQMLTEIANAISPAIAGGTPPRQVAIAVISEIIRLDIGRLIANCSLNPGPVTAFLLDGTLPSGTQADRLLMGTCSGSPTQVAVSLGVGGPIATSTMRARLKQCLAPPDVVGEQRDVCDDPRAAGAEPESGNGLKEDECIHADGTPCTADEVEEDRQTLADEQAFLERVKQYERDTRLFNEGIEEGKRRAREELARQASERTFWDRYEPVVDFILDLQSRGATSILDIIQKVTGTNVLDPCPLGPGKCEAYCAADFARDGYYGSIGELNYGQPRQLNQFDMASHCLCKVMEEEYEQRTGTSLGLSSACPSEVDQAQLDCLANPFGPDDAPRPECVRLLLPGKISDDAWRARICNAARCPEGLKPSLHSDDACECIQPPPTVGREGLGCAASEVAYCTEDNTAPCECMSTNNGSVPHGNDPFCRLDAAGWPGSLDGLLRSNTDAVRLHQLGQESFLTFDARVERAPSVVTATYNRAAFTNIGTVVRQRTLVSAAPRVGENLDLQLYCTNYENNLIHSFMGQCRLNTQAPGVPGSCDIPLNSSTRSSCLGGNFQFEYVSQAPPAYRGTIGAGPWTFRGTLTAPATVNPVCPAPQPFDVFPQTNPVWDLAGGTPINPNPVFELASGRLLTIPPALFLPERFPGLLQ